MNIGLAMGTFGPMHYGHMSTIRIMLDVHKMDKVYVIPCFNHPYGKNMLSFWHIYIMCRDVVDNHFDDRVLVSQIEETLGEFL